MDNNRTIEQYFKESERNMPSKHTRALNVDRELARKVKAEAKDRDITIGHRTTQLLEAGWKWELENGN
jgi:hypothetical protein